MFASGYFFLICRLMKNVYQNFLSLLNNSCLMECFTLFSSESSLIAQSYASTNTDSKVNLYSYDAIRLSQNVYCGKTLNVYLGNFALTESMMALFLIMSILFLY